MNTQPLKDNNTVPVSQVSLHRNGIAHIEHKGCVVGPESLEFVFSRDSINDVMKSLVINSESKENPDIMYNANGNDTVGATLLGSAPSGHYLSEFLHKLRGVNISVKVIHQNGDLTKTESTREGIVMGLQVEMNQNLGFNLVPKNEKENGNENNNNKDFLLMYSPTQNESNGIFSIPLRDVVGIDILSEEVKHKFKGNSS